MDRILSGLYGAGDQDDEPTRVSKAQDFVSRVETGNKAEGYSTEEAVLNYRNVTQELSDDEFEQVAEDALRQLTPEQRREFTQVIKQQAGVDISDNTDDAHELASLTKQFRSSSTGDFGGLLGGLLGGGSGGGAGADDIMGMLGGLLGGGQGGMTGGQGGSSTQAGLAGLISNPIVKMVLGLIAAQAMKRMMGGGGGGASQPAQTNPFGGNQPRQAGDRDTNDSGGGGILDALFGGGGDDNTPQERARQDRNQESGGGGGLLDALFGGGGDDNDDDARRSTGGKTVDVSRIEADRKKKGI